MAILKLSEIIQGCQLCLPAFGHLFMLLPRVPEPKMVVISLLALKWQVFKVEALVFSSISLHKKREKINASTLKNCHFKASRDITTIFRSGTLGNNINNWPKVGRHNWPPCMISDNFKKAILLYVYYMGCIEIQGVPPILLPLWSQFYKVWDKISTKEQRFSKISVVSIYKKSKN